MSMQGYARIREYGSLRKQLGTLYVTMDSFLMTATSLEHELSKTLHALKGTEILNWV